MKPPNYHLEAFGAVVLLTLGFGGLALVLLTAF